MENNHYKDCSVDVSQEPFFCSDHGVYIADDGTELTEADEDTQDWTGAELAQA